MGLYLSIPLLPGVRLGGRIGRRHHRSLIVMACVGMAKLMWWILLAEFYLLVGALAVEVAAAWLVWIVARWAVLTLLREPVSTPRDAIRRDWARISAWWARRR